MPVSPRAPPAARRGSSARPPSKRARRALALLERLRGQLFAELVAQYDRIVQLRGPLPHDLKAPYRVPHLSHVREPASRSATKPSSCGTLQKPSERTRTVDLLLAMARFPLRLPTSETPGARSLCSCGIRRRDLANRGRSDRRCLMSKMTQPGHCRTSGTSVWSSSRGVGCSDATRRAPATRAVADAPWTQRSAFAPRPRRASGRRARVDCFAAKGVMRFNASAQALLDASASR